MTDADAIASVAYRTRRLEIARGRQRTAIERALRIGCSVRQIAAVAGVSRETIRRIRASSDA